MVFQYIGPPNLLDRKSGKIDRHCTITGHLTVSSEAEELKINTIYLKMNTIFNSDESGFSPEHTAPKYISSPRSTRFTKFKHSQNFELGKMLYKILWILGSFAILP